jgi:hypothetical protein
MKRNLLFLGVLCAFVEQRPPSGPGVRVGYHGHNSPYQPDSRDWFFPGHTSLSIPNSWRRGDGHLF